MPPPFSSRELEASVSRASPRRGPGQRPGPAPPNCYWALESTELAKQLASGPTGLTSAEAAARRELWGSNELPSQKQLTRLRALWNQAKNPLLLLLVFAAVASFLAGEWVDACIVLTIVAVSMGIGYAQEYRAAREADALAARIALRATVLRDGRETPLPASELVPGDVVSLAAGTLVPADCVLLESRDLFMSEAGLTGESFPVEKQPGPVAPNASVAEQSGCVFMGTNVRSGWARALVVSTGPRTRFGSIAQHLSRPPPEAEFERGTRHFGYLLTLVMLCMVIFVFGVHVLRGRPPVETLLFAIALAVGLSPELLPAILGVNLAKGAQGMAAHGVLVRHLSAIENLGSMDVLCTDKTGTLTEGVVRLEGAYGPDLRASQEVLRLGAENAALESGIASPLDDSILAAHPVDTASLHKRMEIPFDFVRKRVSVVVGGAGAARLITKGAFEPVLDVCDELPGGRPLDAPAREQLLRAFSRFGEQGIRVLAVATRALPEQESYGREDERSLVFQGFLTFIDQPKEGVRDSLRRLADLGVTVKLISGDSRLVARHLARTVELPHERVLTGRELTVMSDEALWQAAEQTDLFVEVDPNQKERIIRALKKKGHVVGFLGDGVNDAPAMHAADTSLSVDTAVDVAREAADFVLLRRELSVIEQGIREGRRTFANTLKYVLTTTSANLGNMVSMAFASLFLPFLPLTAAQILLNNFVSDIPAIGIADDSVDPEAVARPERWSMPFIARFMVEFGVLSSVFDLLTFLTLLRFFHAGPTEFRTGWFVESLLTELLIALVVRTRRVSYRSRPGRLLLDSSLALLGLTLALPYVPGVAWLGFTPVAPALLGAIVLITLLYVVAAELLKYRFYRRLQTS